MKSGREIVEILEAYDLTGSYRAAAELAGCDHHTVARYVKLRAEGRSPEERAQRSRPVDDFMDKIEELVARSGGRIRADVVHRRITAMGFAGGERTTRRAVAGVKKSWQAGQFLPGAPVASPPCGDRLRKIRWNVLGTACAGLSLPRVGSRVILGGLPFQPDAPPVSANR